MLLFTATALTLITIFYLNYAISTAKERKLKESIVYANAQTEWKNIQLWYKQEHPKKALPFEFLLDTGSWIGLQMSFYNENGNINYRDNLKPSEFVIAIQKIKNHMKQYGYK